jgi:hypothetical protein
MTADTTFIKNLAAAVGAEVSEAMPESGGFASVSWDAKGLKQGAGLVKAIAEAVIEKKPGVKFVMLKREYDIEVDDYTKHRVVFW